MTFSLAFSFLSQLLGLVNHLRGPRCACHLQMVASTMPSAWYACPFFFLSSRFNSAFPRPLNQSRGKSHLSTPPSRDGARHRTHQEHGSCSEYSSYHRTPRPLSLDSTDVWSQGAVLCRGGSPVQGGMLNGIIGLYSECW